MTIYYVILFSDCLNLCCKEDAEADPRDLRNSETTAFNNKQEIFFAFNHAHFRSVQTMVILMLMLEKNLSIF